MVEPLSVAAALGKLFGPRVAREIGRWIKGSEAAQLVKLLKPDFPAAKSLLTQPEVLGELWLYAETGEFRRAEMVRAIRPLTGSEREAEDLAEAIRDKQWRAIRDERQTHFEFQRLAAEMRANMQANEERILARLDEALAGLAKALPAARQLPAQSLPFVDRKDEIAAGERLLRERPGGNAAVILNCSGMAGIGKSAFVLELAHRRSADFSAGVLFVEMRSPDGRIRDPAEIASRLLRDLGVSPTAIPQDAQERLGALRSILAETPVMLVLDDVADEKQVRELIPASPSSMVLITSRAPLALGTAESIDLAELGEKDATLLLESIVGKRVRGEPEAAAEIVARCRGLPLALIVVAGRARRQPTLPLSAFVPAEPDGGDLAELDDPDGTLLIALTSAIDSAGEPARRLLLLLAALKVTEISAPLAAALVQTSVGEARRLIEKLGDERLLIPVEGGGWKIHDLLRMTARSLAHRELAEDEIASAQKRRVNWLVNDANEHVRDLKGEV